MEERKVSIIGLYHRPIEHVKQNRIVLTEHVGDQAMRVATTDAEINTLDTA